MPLNVLVLVAREAREGTHADNFPDIRVRSSK